jgi:hypothetical protein
VLVYAALTADLDALIDASQTSLAGSTANAGTVVFGGQSQGTAA